MDSLVSSGWLAAEMGADDLKLVDATAFLPEHERDAQAEYEAGHIPGTMFLDLHELADSDDPLPMMMPSEVKFASRMQALGLGDGDRIVVYDNSPLRSAARAWWMLRAFGSSRVALLDGGLQKWKAEGRSMESGSPAVRRGHFTATLSPGQLADKLLIAGILGDSGCELVDARSAERFAGEKPEPRPGVAPGHIPGSKNLPQERLFNPDNSWKRGEALRAAFVEAGIDLAKPMIATCGSGVTAAVLLFGAHLLGKDDVKLYDGSWAEWGSDPATPKAVGRA